ncbi:hypothetical protein SLS55_002402 [Diplodia seriata]|uniref:SGNH hydrolase-type esterase domain-containing protein n=2 Tax=Diplodia seriata TaxID=420778 RepID=A0ABR3CS28_9PEZI
MVSTLERIALDVVNRGFNGYNTEKALKVLPRFMPSPDEAKTVFFGANDACVEGSSSKQHVSLERYMQNLREICTHACVKAHSPRLIIITPTPVDERRMEPVDIMKGHNGLQRTAEHTRKYANAARKVGEELNLPVLDLWSILMARAGWVAGEPLPGCRSVERNKLIEELMNCMFSVMDPQSVSFTPRDDLWRIHSEMLRVQQTQTDHADRLARLERRQDEDARVKSVWGASSPFPSVLGGTPQQVPLQQPTADAFSSFDDQSTNLLSSLHLDADEEPRRLGTTSRANSVRFDETANQGHWSHASRSSMDLIPRTGSSLGGHPMTERSFSHKSDGRQSSAAASVHSATSGRANSLGLDSTFPVGAPTLEVPRLAPGLFILGSVPAIIRCWLNRNFKHDSLLYAAVCTGSYTSCLDLALITKLGFQSEIRYSEDGVRKIKLELYLPEAIPYPASSRSGSPTPQLPSLTVDFTVVESQASEKESKAVKVFLGSDLLRSHNADILLSSNTLTLFDDDRSKLSVPLVRPEDDHAFKTLQVSSSPWIRPDEQDKYQDTYQEPATNHAAVGERPMPQTLEGLKAVSVSPVPPGSDSDRNVTVPSSDDGNTSQSDRRSLERPAWGPSIRNDAKEPSEGESSGPGLSRSGSSPAIWSNWRRTAERSESMDWAGASKVPSNDTYQRRDTGIKVLKPIRTSSRTPSMSQGPASVTTPTSQSRFFDEGRRRVTSVSSVSTAGADTQQQQQQQQPKRTISTDLSKMSGSTRDGSKPRSTNPIGGASAFSWLKNGQK